VQTLRNARVVERQNLGADPVWHSLQRAAASAPTQTNICVDDLARRITDLENVIRQRTAARSHDHMMDATYQTSDNLVRLKQCLDRLEQSTTTITDGIQQSTVNAKDLLELKKMLALHLQSTQYTPASANMSGSAPSTATSNLPKVNLSQNNLKILLRRLSVEVEVVLRSFLASLFVFLRDILMALPQINMIWKILRRLPPTISLVLHDNIRFEDALGRVQSLQYQQFKYWTVFEANLRCAFTNSPGMQKVLDGSFVLISSLHGERLTPSNWTLRVRPGLEIQMSITIKRVLMWPGRCLRSASCGGYTRRISEWEYCCLVCGLLISCKNESLTPETPVTASKNVSSTEVCPVLSASNIGSQRSAPEHGRNSSASVLTGVTIPASPSQHILGPKKRILEWQNETREIEVLKRVHLGSIALDIHLL
jgi:hypothetical protein